MRNKTALMTFILLALSIAGYPFNSNRMKSSARDFAGPQEKTPVGDAKPGTSGHKAPPPTTAQTTNDCGCVRRSSPIEPVECSDTNFLVDCDIHDKGRPLCRQCAKAFR
jgi:hypothetical protein